MKLSEFDYNLPRELIAQTPAQPRDHARLMIVNRKSGTISHDHFYNLPKYLQPDDLLVFNQTKVIPARILAKKESGGKLEILLLKQLSGFEWEVISKPGLKQEESLLVNVQSSNPKSQRNLKLQVLNKQEDGTMVMRFDVKREELLKMGEMPLPPYIRAKSKENRAQYQTIYARDEGSVAAPTAGFHFTKGLMGQIGQMGVMMEFITLHVGLGTFVPVRVENIEDHRMHSESYFFDGSKAQRFKVAKRIVAVGTTSVRTLEAWAKTGKTTGETDIFIYPGYKFRVVDAMITNFHLPKSTLLMLVSAFAGQDLIKRAYQEAIREKYRFFSFGDGMLIL